MHLVFLLNLDGAYHLVLHVVLLVNMKYKIFFPLCWLTKTVKLTRYDHDFYDH